jgi:hypothetical protein
MNNTGFRAFLLGTARDQVPVRGIWFTVQRRDAVEAAAGSSGVMKVPPTTTGVSESNGTDPA